MWKVRAALCAGVLAMLVAAPPASATGWGRDFKIEEATIGDIQKAILRRQITTTDVVEAYLERIKAYNGTCVSQPQGILGPITMLPHAGKVNALMTLNLRPKSRATWGFDERKARSMTDSVDNDPRMPDALETAARMDQKLSRHGQLSGPLHGAVFAIKDQYDTFDMRTTSGADAFWANDRPPDDATVVQRLREAGAIILAKANMDEYAGGDARSSFGGTGCNAYDTERDPGGSSGGSAVSVATNLVTCAIAEETGGSIVKPARWNNVVGLVPTRELVSADGMIQRGLNTRVGPMCRTVADVAKVLSAYAGFDPKDELTAFATNRKPERPYEAYADGRRLNGYRIGVIREYMNKALFTIADSESIDLIDRAVGDLRRLGATIVDPGPTGALLQSCVDRFAPKWLNQQFTPQWPALFPAGGDHNTTLLDMFFRPELVPHTAAGRPSIRNVGGTGSDAGDGRYNFNAYIRERGDASIRVVDRLDQQGELLDRPGARQPQVEPGEHRPWADAGHGQCHAVALRGADDRLPVLRRAGPGRRRLSVGQHPAGRPDRPAGAHGQRPRAELDDDLEPRLRGYDRPGRLHDPRLRPRRRRRAAPGQARTAPGRDRLPRPAVHRAHAVLDRLRLRGGDAPPQPAARVRAAAPPLSGHARPRSQPLG